MSTIPPNLSRVPNSLTSRLALGNLTRANLGLLNVQEQISSGFAINRVSDDPVKASLVSVLDDRLERTEQRKRNIVHAQSALGDLDAALGEINTIALDAKQIASEMVNTTFSASDRASQAPIVQQLINGILSQGNRKGAAGHLFGGSQPGTPPFVEFRGGVRFVSSGPGITTDLDLARTVPITMAPNNPVGATSGRVRGDVDLDPDLMPSTRLASLSGARNLGVAKGTVEFSVNGGSRISVDLTSADTVTDVAIQLTAAIRQYEADNSVTILGPGGVATGGESFTVDMLAGNTVQFFDPGTGSAARDLGLAADVAFTFTSASPSGRDLGPKLSWDTPIAGLATLAGPLGSLRIKNAGASAVVDLSTAATLEDVRNAIEAAVPGTRVVINDAGTGIDVVTEVSGGRALALSIEEVGGATATALGIRTFGETTRLSDFNDGRGVRIIDGVVDPTTGVATTALNADFEIRLGNVAGTRITVDLTPADMTTVQTMLTAVQNQVATQLASAGLAPGDLTVGLAPDGNGLRFTQNAAFPGAVSFGQLNNSQVLRDLGIEGGSYNASTSSYTGVDAATIRPDNLFTHLMDLRDALASNDMSGIALAGEKVDDGIARLAEVRGLVGGYAKRVDFAERLLEDQTTMDTKIRSELRDTDFTEAAMRLGQLQTQLQAGYRVTGLLGQQTLLDFLR
jgi:flagellin-like hook-associated protein FlgL